MSSNAAIQYLPNLPFIDNVKQNLLKKNNCNLRRVVISENVNFDFCSSKLHQLILCGKRRMSNDENELDYAKINIQT